MPNSLWSVHVLLSGHRLGASVALLRNGLHNVVVDTGMPHEAHLLEEALARHDLKWGDVGIVINTHLHVDHATNNGLFTRAELMATEECFDWCSALYADLADEENWERLVLKYYPETPEYDRAAKRMHQLRKVALRIWSPQRLGPREHYRWIEKGVLPVGLEWIATPGHLPGHISLLAESAQGKVVLSGDALLARQNDDEILTMIPHSREQFERDRATISTMAGRIIPGHDREFIQVNGGATLNV